MEEFFRTKKSVRSNQAVSISNDWRKEIAVYLNTLAADHTALKEKADSDLHCMPF